MMQKRNCIFLLTLNILCPILWNISYVQIPFGKKNGNMSSENVCTLSCVISVKSYLSSLSATHLQSFTVSPSQAPHELVHNLFPASHKPAERLKSKETTTTLLLNRLQHPQIRWCPETWHKEEFHSTLSHAAPGDAGKEQSHVVFYTFFKAPEVVSETKCYSFTPSEFQN